VFLEKTYECDTPITPVFCFVVKIGILVTIKIAVAFAEIRFASKKTYVTFTTKTKDAELAALAVGKLNLKLKS